QLRRRQLLSRRLGLLLRHGIKCRHHGTFPLTIRSANQAGNTLRSTVPNVALARDGDADNDVNRPVRDVAVPDFGSGANLVMSWFGVLAPECSGLRVMVSPVFG
ncbi:hypothetical protein, partial [Nocardia asiatica]|uniref:hypothetical protein n=1 Tax=Nocardia asiatica TaxID=209252 RepID=UPI0024543DAB